MDRLFPQSLLFLKLTSWKSRQKRSLNTHLMHVNKNKHHKSPLFCNSSLKHLIRGKTTDSCKRKKIQTLAVSSVLLALEYQVLGFGEGKKQKDYSRGAFGR